MVGKVCVVWAPVSELALFVACAAAWPVASASAIAKRDRGIAGVGMVGLEGGAGNDADVDSATP